MSEKTIDRRGFLTHGLAGFSLAATAPHFLSLSSRVFADAGGGLDARVLVVLQLSGGNDGLSTVVPYADDAYYRARRQTAIAQKDVLKLNDYVGFHPTLKKAEALFKDGRLAIVQGASYPNPNRSHFKSMDVWHTGDLTGRRVDSGWIGRAIDSCCPEPTGPDQVVNIGRNIPYALKAKINKPVSFEDPQRYRWSGNPQDAEDFEKLNDSHEGEMDDIRWLHRVAVDARTSSDKIRKAAQGYKPKGRYPRGRLANDLRTVAALIAGGLDTRVYYVSFGGFDTHNNQRNRYNNLMTQLDGAVGAFMADLRAHGLSDRVLLLSFSEFGRRVVENGSAGTDHGVAGPMFLCGDAVKAGVHQDHPSLTDLDRGDLKMTTDFRSVYATVLEDWMGIDVQKVLGRRYPKLPLL